MWQDKRISRCYGRSLVGERAVVKKVMQNWDPRITAIPILCTEGMVDLGLYEGNVNAATFLDFVTEKLCPNILPFNGVNPRSIVILGKEDRLLGNHAFRERFSFRHCSPPTKFFHHLGMKILRIIATVANYRGTNLRLIFPYKS